ncbi:MAG: hypothetical protein WC791_01820 [Candidatus Paceibacterota bacterium]|jgi:hypothetical protein
MSNTQEVDSLQATREAIVQEELWIVSFEAQKRVINTEIEHFNKDLIVLDDKIQKKRVLVAEMSEKLRTQTEGGSNETR